MPDLEGYDRMRTKRPMVCWFHHWSKWSAPEDMVFEAYGEHRGAALAGNTVTLSGQVRICQRCGRIEARRLEDA